MIPLFITKHNIKASIQIILRYFLELTSLHPALVALGSSPTSSRSPHSLLRSVGAGFYPAHPVSYNLPCNRVGRADHSPPPCLAPHFL